MIYTNCWGSGSVCFVRGLLRSRKAERMVSGMTIGEYALMLAGENLLSAKANDINKANVKTKPTADTPFHVQVIKCKNYDHKTKYVLPVNPSPNLKEMQSIYLYPTSSIHNKAG